MGCWQTSSGRTGKRNKNKILIHCFPLVYVLTPQPMWSPQHMVSGIRLVELLGIYQSVGRAGRSCPGTAVRGEEEGKAVFCSLFPELGYEGGSRGSGTGFSVNPSKQLNLDKF